MDTQIIFWTQAYNAEKTLKRTIESVLNQTRKDFTYYVLDHASDDTTYDIILEYSKKDPRLIPLRSDVNVKGVFLNYASQIQEKHGNAWTVILDADDEYEPNFLEKMMDFVEFNNLDIGFSASVKIQAHGGIEPENFETLICNKDAFFEKHFSDYYKYTTALWRSVAKLNNVVHAIITMSEKDGVPLGVSVEGGHFIDNLVMFRHLLQIDKVGFLTDRLHKRYFSEQAQLSNKYTSQRFSFIIKIINALQKELVEMSPATKKAINIRFILLFKWALSTLFRSADSLEIKFNDLTNMFSHKHTKKILYSDWEEIGITTIKKIFLEWNINYVLKQEINSDEEQALQSNLLELLNKYMEECC